jgi:hypothetical protein
MHCEDIISVQCRDVSCFNINNINDCWIIFFPVQTFNRSSITHHIYNVYIKRSGKYDDVVLRYRKRVHIRNSIKWPMGYFLPNIHGFNTNKRYSTFYSRNEANTAHKCNMIGCSKFRKWMSRRQEAKKCEHAGLSFMW